MLYGYRQFRCIHKNDIYDDVYKDIAEDVDIRFDTSNYELDRPFPNGKIKKVIGLMKDKLGGKIMTKSVGLRAKTYSYLVDDSSKNKKPKAQKNCVIKRKLEYKNYNVFTGEINKIALSSNDNKKVRSIDSIETFAYGTRKDLVSEKEETKCNNIIK